MLQGSGQGLVDDISYLLDADNGCQQSKRRGVTWFHRLSVSTLYS